MTHNNPNSTKYIAFIFFLITLALISKIGIFSQVFNLTPETIIQSDTVRYELPALQLLKEGTLAIKPQFEHTTTLSTTPIYSLFIAGTYQLFGEKNHFALITLQLVISSLTILFIYFTALKLWTQKIAITSAVFMALEPLQTLYAQTILSETLFTFFLSASLFSFVHLLSSNKKFQWALGLGIFLTLATMTRPISYYLVFCIILGLAIFKQRFADSWSQLAGIILLILLPFLLITTAWKLRNENLTGIYALNDAMSETLLYYKAKGVLMTAESISESEAQAEILNRLPKTFNTPKERATEETKLAKEIILGDLKSYFKLSLSGLKPIILGPGLTSQAMFYDIKNYGKTDSGEYKLWYLFLVSYGVAFMLLTYIFSAYGFLTAFKSARAPQDIVIHILMLGAIFYFVLISTGHIATDSRMRVPIIPIILLYASYGVYKLFETFKAYKLRKNKTN